VVHLTNAAWIIDAERIGRDLGAERVVLMNDYVPVAMALSNFSIPETLTRLGPDLAGDRGTRLVLGPGTGLGAAALVPVGECFTVISTEAGHTEFGACDPEDFDLWPLIERVHGRLTSETILSGPGLMRLYHALAKARGIAPTCVSPAEIVAFGGGAGGRDLAAAALTLFARLLGRFAGDLALVFSASGGVHIAGGIAPRMISILDQGEFRSAFEQKAPFDDVVRQMPTCVVTDPEPGLTGLALFAANPSQFLINTQGWRRS
jgi:glucokinase